METIKLDLIPGKKIPSLHASQYDDGREHGIDLFENGVVYKLDGTETLTINERKGDDCICSLDIENTFADTNHIVFASTEQMCAVWGNNICELVIAKGEKTIGTLNFILEVEPSPTEGGIESESEIKNLKRQVEAITEEVIGDNYYTKTQTDNAIATAIEDINNIIASEYDEEETYYRGDIVLYNGVLYECDNTDASGEFNPSDWKEITLGEGIEDVRDLLADYYTKSQSDYRFLGKTNPTGSGYFGLNRSGSVGANSVSVGWHNVANAQSSFAEGESNTSSGYASHSEGYGNAASGLMAHAEGVTTESSGYGSHSEGVGTIANHIGQHVIGTYNVADPSEAQPTAKGNYIEIVGNGTDDNRRRNARTLDWGGNETLMGDLTFNGNKSLASEISRLDNRITDLPEPMVLKGTLGVGGTIETLPTASAENEGWTFKCITAGTYEDLTLKVGDTVTCFNPPNTSTYYWDKTGSQDTDTDTWRAIKVNGVEKLGNGISSGAVDFEDTTNVKFEFDANGNKIKATLDGIYTESEVDNLLDEKADKETTYTKEQVDDIVYNILPDDTASGSVANFDTSLELPIKSLEVDVNAVQEAGTPTPASPLPISGWSEIKNAHTGKNLLDESGRTNLVNNIRYYVTNGVLLKAGTYTLSISEQVSGLYIKEFITNDTLFVKYNSNFFTFTLAEDTRVWIDLYKTGINTNDTVQLEVGSSASTYESFNGTTEVINLGGTYYGGYVSQDRDGHRQFEVTHKAKIKLRDVGYWNYSSSGNRFYANNIDDVYQKTDWNNHIGLCDCYVEGKVGNNQGDDLAYGFYNASLYIRDSNYSDVTTWLNAVGDYYITYQLATPYVIDLPDGEPIITLNGTNNIYADTGDCAVEYKVSVEQYVSNHSGGGLGGGLLGGGLGGAKSGGSEEEPTEESKDTEKTKEIDEPKEETKTIGDMKKLGGE